MSTTLSGQTALGDNAARQLANATKTVPQLSTITPRWLTHLLQWVPVEAGIYRLNRVKDPEAVRATCTAREDEGTLPTTFVPYEEQPREYFLNAVSTVLDVHTRISDLYSSPHDQIKEQLKSQPDGQLSMTDPDARSMATSGRGSGMVGYNVQVAVDAKHHLIVAHEVTNSGSDRAQLSPIAKAARDAMGKTSLRAVADRGYYSGPQYGSVGPLSFTAGPASLT